MFFPLVFVQGIAGQLFGDQAGAALTREQVTAAQRGNVETANLMRNVSQNGGVQALGSDPITQAMLIGSGYDPQDFSRIGLMGAVTETDLAVIGRGGRLAALLLRAHGIVTRTDRRWISRLLPAIAAEDPELAVYLRGLVVL